VAERQIINSTDKLDTAIETLEAAAEQVEVAEGLVLLRNKRVTEAAGNTNSVYDKKPACDQRTTEKEQEVKDTSQATIQKSEEEEVDKSEFSRTI
jgi:hypothetical protein